MSNEGMDNFIRDIISLYRNHLKLRSTLNIEDFLEHGEPQLAIETLCGSLHVNEIYLSTEIGNELLLLGEDWEIGNLYFNLIPPLILSPVLIRKKIRNILIALKNENPSLKTLINHDLCSFFQELIDMINSNHEEISNKIYREIIRLSYLAAGFDPSLCLKMNNHVTSHIERNKSQLDKVLFVVDTIKPPVKGNEIQQIHNFVKYNEITNAIDGVGYLMEENNIFIDIKTFDALTDVAIAYNCADLVEPLIRYVKE